MFDGRALKAGIATTIVATSLFAPLAGNAFARGREKPRNERIVRVKTECNRDIAKHLREYDAVTKLVANSPWLTDAHAAALTAAVAEAKAAAVADKTELNAATDLETARKECRSARSHHRHLKTILRVGRTTQRADRYDAAILSLQNDLNGVGDKIDGLEADGIDGAEFRSILDGIQGAIDEAQSNVGLGDAIIALLDSEEPQPALDEYNVVLSFARDNAMAISESIDALDQLVNPPVEEGDGGEDSVGEDA